MSHDAEAGRCRGRASGLQREKDTKTGAAADGAVEPDRAAQGVDDAAHDVQPQTVTRASGIQSHPAGALVHARPQGQDVDEMINAASKNISLSVPSPLTVRTAPPTAGGGATLSLGRAIFHHIRGLHGDDWNPVLVAQFEAHRDNANRWPAARFSAFEAFAEEPELVSWTHGVGETEFICRQCGDALDPVWQAFRQE